MDPGQAQTPFAETPFVTEAFVNLSVDKSFLEIGQFRLFLGPRRSIDHEHADALAHLRCGKPYPIGIVHRLPHVGDELLRKKAEKNYWKNLTANFIAQKPART